MYSSSDRCAELVVNEAGVRVLGEVEVIARAQDMAALACLSQLRGLAADKLFGISEGVRKVFTTDDGYPESGLLEEIRRRGAWPYAHSGNDLGCESGKSGPSILR